MAVSASLFATVATHVSHVRPCRHTSAATSTAQLQSSPPRSHDSPYDVISSHGDGQLQQASFGHVVVNASDLGWDCRGCDALRRPDPATQDRGCEFDFVCSRRDCGRLPSAFFEAQLLSRGRCVVNGVRGTCQPIYYYIPAMQLKIHRQSGLARLSNVQLRLVTAYKCVARHQ